MTDKKQLDCELHCKSTAGLNYSIIQDLLQPDTPMAELVEEKETDETENKPDIST